MEGQYRASTLARQPTQDEIMMDGVKTLVQGVAEVLSQQQLVEARLLADTKRHQAIENTKAFKTAGILTLVGVGMLLLFAYLSLRVGGDGVALASDALKFGLGAIVGGFGGWGIGRKRGD